MTGNTMIGVDLAKSVFQVHGALLSGEVQFRRKLTRQHFRKFMAEQGPSIVVMEACGLLGVTPESFAWITKDAGVPELNDGSHAQLIRAYGGRISMRAYGAF